MNKKIIVIGIIILLIGIIAPQSGAVQETNEQQNSMLTDEIYYRFGEVFIYDNDVENITVDYKLKIGRFYFGVEVKATISNTRGYIEPALPFGRPRYEFEVGDEVTITSPLVTDFDFYISHGFAYYFHWGFHTNAVVTRASDK